MKIIFSLLSFVLSTISYGQLITNNNNLNVYLDSNKIDLQNYLFDQNKIEKFEIVKKGFDSRTNTTRSIYITSKKPQGINFLSYEQIKSEYFADRSKPILLLLNGTFIKSPTILNIDSSYISKVEVETGEDYIQLRKLYPSMAIVNIKLKNFDRTSGEMRIYLDGMPFKNDPE